MARAITGAAAAATSPAYRSRRAPSISRPASPWTRSSPTRSGAQTRFPSLEVGLEDARQSGDCDSGYSCAYTNNLAWRSGDPAAAAGPRPASALRAPVRQRRRAESRSARRASASTAAAFWISSPKIPRSSKSGLGPTDRRKLDEYLSSIREVERQLEQGRERTTRRSIRTWTKPYGVPADFAEHFKLMTDMMTIAFQADLTRVMTFLVTHEGTSRAYREIGIPDGHHPLTHHRNQEDLMEKVAQINVYHMKQFAGWIEKLKSIKEGDGTLLDNSHDRLRRRAFPTATATLHEDLPTLIAGSAGKTIKTGRRVVYRRETPMCNLFLGMMDRMGVHTDHFGDSTWQNRRSQPDLDRPCAKTYSGPPSVTSDC